MPQQTTENSWQVDISNTMSQALLACQKLLYCKFGAAHAVTAHAVPHEVETRKKTLLLASSEMNLAEVEPLNHPALIVSFGSNATLHNPTASVLGKHHEDCSVPLCQSILAIVLE